MTDHAKNTMPRAEKGALGPAPQLEGTLQEVADAVAAWPGVVSTVHWDLYAPDSVDGADFYVGEVELGHIHLDGFLHLATSPELGRDMVTAGLARPFPYARGWVHEQIQTIGAAAAISLLRRNYERLNTLVAR